MKNKVKKYNFGGIPIKNFIQTPDNHTVDNQIAIQNAIIEGQNMNNVQNLKLLAPILGAGLQTGINYYDNTNNTNPNIYGNKPFKNGGKVNNLVPIEVEGGEIAELPSGQLKEYQGPNHENGGIKTIVPSGTEIFSKRIKIDNKTMADRKKSRDRKLKKIKKDLEENKNDPLKLNTLKKMQKDINFEEQSDMLIQQNISSIQNNNLNKFNDGGIVKNKSLYSDIENDQSILGDSLVIGGNLVNTINPLLSTLSNKPNLQKLEFNDNFENFGDESLKISNQLIENQDGELSQNIQDIRRNRTNNFIQNRDTSRGLNQLRALNILANNQSTNQEINARIANSKVKNDLLSKKQNLLNTIDSTKATSKNRIQDLKLKQLYNNINAQNNYNTNLAQSVNHFGSGLSAIGGNINKRKETKEYQRIISELKKELDRLTTQKSIPG